MPWLGQAARKHAPSNSHDYEPDPESDLTTSDSGLVEHLGSDLPDPNDSFYASRQLLHEAASQSPAGVGRSSALHRATGAGDESRTTDANPLSPSKSVNVNMDRVDNSEPRRSTGKLKRVSRSSLRAAPSTRKRKQPDERDEEEETEVSKSPRPNRSSTARAFREQDWNVEDDDHTAHETTTRSNGDAVIVEAQGQAGPKEVATQAPRKKGARRTEADRLAASTEEWLKTNQQDHEPPRSSRRASGKAGGGSEAAAPQEQGLNDQIGSLKTTKSTKAKASSRQNRSRQQRPIVGDKSNVLAVDNDGADESEVESIHVPKNVAKRKAKARRPKASSANAIKPEPSALPKAGAWKHQVRHHPERDGEDDEPSAVRKAESWKHQMRHHSNGNGQNDDTMDALFVNDNEPSSSNNESNEQQVGDATANISPLDSRRFFGQYSLLLGLDNRISKKPFDRKPSTKSIKKFQRRCRDIVDLLGKTGTRDVQDDAAARTRCETELAEKVISLLQRTHKLDPDKSSDGQLYAYDIYRSAFPELISVFLAHCEYFELRGGLDSDALEDLSSLAKTILMLRRRAIRWHAKPDPGSHIVTHTANHVIAPLRIVYTVFMKKAAELRRSEQMDDERRRAQEVHARQREEWALFEQELAIRNDQIRRLQELYLTRQEVEPDRKRREAFGLPQPMLASVVRPNIDANGSAFERINLFGARAGSTQYRRPAALPPAVWTTEQRLDLMEGLERFSGLGASRVFSLVIRRYCGPRGSLCDFMVHQLLEEAAELREDMLKVEQRDGTEMPRFIRDLPDLDLLGYLVRRYAE